MITIREMQEQDVEMVHCLDTLCLPQEAWSKQSLLEEISSYKARTLLAFEGEELAGFLNAHVVLDEANINTIAVFPQYRRKGIARLLLEQLIVELEQNGSLSVLMLEVRKSNETAIAFYQKNAFQLVGERKNFYHNPVETALLFTRIFEQNEEEDNNENTCN